MADALEGTDHVLDASAAAKLFLDEPESEAFRAWYVAEVAAGARFGAPSLLAYEVAHLLARNLKPPSRDHAAWLAERLDEALTGIELDEGAAARVFQWTRALTAYDASYLAVAASTGATLVSYDRALIQEAARSGIPTRSPR